MAILRRNAEQIVWLKIERCVFDQSRTRLYPLASLPGNRANHARLAVYRVLDIIQRLT